MLRFTEKTTPPAKESQVEKTNMESCVLSGSQCDLKINLSKALSEALMVKKLVHPDSGVRAHKIYALRKKIEKGEYKIDCEKIAESVLRTFMDEQVAPSVESMTFPAVKALSLS
jgi:anti-sigma28 factor (negative regulator of flagellin synthesis)